MDQDHDVTRTDAGLQPAYLVLYRGAARLEAVELPVGGRLTIGRASSNRVVVPDAKCSRQHCELYFRGGQWNIRDLDSRNGVTVDGLRVEGEQPLRYGETIGIGACTLVLTDRHPEESGSVSREESQDQRQTAYEIIERKSGTQYDDPGSGLQRMQHHKDGATELFRIARSMAATDSIHDLCRVVLEGLCTRTGADIGGVLIVPLDDAPVGVGQLQPIAVQGDRSASSFSTFLSKIALEDKDAILAHDIAGHSELSGHDSLQELSAQSAICAPIRHEGMVQGVIHLYSTRAHEPLTQPDLEFVLAVADQMGDQLFSLREREELEAGLKQVRRQISDLQDQLQADTELVGQSSNLESVRRAIGRVAPTDALVLIRGESGVGKELVARAVHFNSQRRDGPFVCVNCAALTESLLESELFGHEKGAFTGASGKRLGKFEQAHGGTIFLDEIGEMSPEIQAKFLRVLEGQPFERVGGGEPVTVDVRVVTATNRDLEQAVREGKFRRDLFFRLQVIEIDVPPLRKHPEDIPLIAQHFMTKFATQAHRKIRGLTPGAIRKLQEHDWPGNVRELRNVIERAVILSEDEMLDAADIVLTRLKLDEPSAPSAQPGSTDAPRAGAAPVFEDTHVDPLVDLWGSYIQQQISLDDIDRMYIQAVLESTGWNKSKAARILQIERTTLDRRLKKYKMSRPGNGDSDDENGDSE
jgi:transcriptional regulator with GAF, ATPase, and Fis domain